MFLSWKFKNKLPVKICGVAHVAWYQKNETYFLPVTQEIHINSLSLVSAQKPF